MSLWDVVYGGEVNGKLDGTQVHIVVSATASAGTDGGLRPPADTIIANIISAGLHCKKAGAVHKIYAVRLRDDQTVAAQA